MFVCPAESDNPGFTSLINRFVNVYAEATSADRILVVKIDNWFGERWLGFAATLKGVAGVRQRHGKLSTDEKSLAIPPFRPSRVLSVDAFEKSKQQWLGTSPPRLHVEKNGGVSWNLFRNGLYCWYSSNTTENSSGCLMVYEVNAGGEDAWYMHFDRSESGKWNVTKCRNTQIANCRQIVESHYAESAG